MNMPTDGQLNEMAVKIHGGRLTIWVTENGVKVRSRTIPTTFKALTPAKRRDIMALCIAANASTTTLKLPEEIPVALDNNFTDMMWRAGQSFGNGQAIAAR